MRRPTRCDKTALEVDGNPMMMHVVSKEISRVSPGFAMGFGVSIGLVRRLVTKVQADQIEKYGLPISTMQADSARVPDEPNAGSDAFGSMRTTAKPSRWLRSCRAADVHHNGPGADVFLVYAKIDRGSRAERRSRRSLSSAAWAGL